MIRIIDYARCSPEDILTRGIVHDDVSQTVAQIIARVKAEGDGALFEYTAKFDRAELTQLLVSEEEIEQAIKLCDNELIQIMEQAAQNIRDYHMHQLQSSFIISENEGVILGQKVTPLSRVGIYVPGGTAAYPSTVLMNTIPAKLAGVKEIIMFTPPCEQGTIKPAILAAARIAGVDKIYKVGGAQAIAALAYGTQSIPRCVKIVGPGNVFVAEAKRQVYGLVDIDMIAGPSEILIIADSTANSSHLAADMLSQAEHDRNASAVLITDCADLAHRVSNQLEQQLPMLEREEIARASIEANAKIIYVDSLDQAVEAANIIAPEHLELCIDNPFDYLDGIENAGSIFLGKYTPEALGDYFAGTNHTLPTSGTAKFSSPLSVEDFIKKSAFSYYTKPALEKVYKKVARFACEEGLGGHARSALIRFEEPSKL